ncbi:hypothetical protein [Ectobacillus funiculus]|uniref:Bacterial Pleckstrin homology domain-containing protein n=1 Tax=Ectobacillus funiculus TaxID=137993 RepID=A0ABV5WPQ1_9BACI
MKQTYQEVQYMPWYTYIPIFLISGFIWYGWIQQTFFNISFGDKPMSNAELLLGSMIGLALSIFFVMLRLVTEVKEEGIIVRFTPLRSRYIPYTGIAGMEVVSYHLLSYGGLGLRWTPYKGWAYIMGSMRGVKLQFADGEELLIGSKDPERLLQLIESQKWK